MPLIDPIELLTRDDKWYLGNGGLLIYAPPFPQYLRTPGFWDECHFGDLAVPRLLCLSFALELPPGHAGLNALDGKERSKAEPAGGRKAAGKTAAPAGGTVLMELEAHLNTWQWYPDRIEARHYLVRRDGLGYKQQYGQRLFLNETRRIAPDGTLSCELSFEAMTDLPPATLHIVAWTARQKGAVAAGTSGERSDSHRDFSWDGSVLSYTQAVSSRSHARGVQALPLTIRMQGSRKPASVQVTPSHAASLQPRLSYTPLWDELKQGRLSGEVVGDNVLGSVVYAGLHWRFPVSAAATPKLSVYVNVAAAKHGGSTPAPSTAAGSASASPTAAPAQAWREFLSLVPHFECSDEMLTRYYWYRWYGLRLNSVARGGNYIAPAVAEGIAYFRGVISYSLMCHVQECKWLADPALARGCLQNHLAYQTRAGHLSGHIYLNYVNDRGFYHTDVGGAAAALLQHHPDADFANSLRRPLARLLHYYTSERDTEGLGLFDVRDQYETGQEFSSRYFLSDKRADLYGWEHKLKLKGVDVTHYVYRLACYLREDARARADKAALRNYGLLAEKIRSAVQEHLWDESASFYFDYSAEHRKRSPYWVAVGFYPLLSDLATPDQALAASRHLQEHERFAAAWPTPTVATDDPYFAADPRWRGERANCPWNGRVWPMVNSHIVDVLGQLAELDPPRFRPQLAQYLRRFVEMMHYERFNAPTVGAAGGAGALPAKDFTRPNCFEHYHPLDGTACEYRGIDDYMHSEVVNPILKYAAGVRLEAAEGGQTRLIVDPFPFGFTHLLLTNCSVHGHRLDVCFNRDRRGAAAKGYSVYLDGKVVWKGTAPTRWEAVL